MADISDDEMIEKPKRVMTDKQKEALKKGRELAKANREKSKETLAKPALVRSEAVAEEPSKTPTASGIAKVAKEARGKKKVKEAPVVEVPVPEVKEEPVKGKRVSRKPKVEKERSPSPPREVSPPPAPKKKRTPRQKPAPIETPVQRQVSPAKKPLVFV